MRTEAERIKNALTTVLPNRRFELEPVNEGSSPLFLLLTLNRHKVGFAMLDGKPDENYAEALEQLRSLYSKHAGDWADLDLTLILCNEKTKELDDIFRNKVEIDAYFCRKFVIDLEGNLEYELKRLPFVPLLLEVEHELKMPVNAQSFLIKHGTDSALARGLAVPHAMGIDTIISKCLNDVFGKLDWLGDLNAGLMSLRERKGIPIRLKNINLSSFRAYRKLCTFDLDADIVVFYGPNGLGKTSLFDAIDFACTGGVSKLDERFSRKTDKLVNALKHLDAPVEDSCVSITLSANGTESKLERFIQNRATAYVNGNSSDRTRTLMFLAGLQEKPADARIENLVRLFRSSHLFGQEYQSLTSAFKDKSILDENIVSRMLALQDYVESIHKGRKTLDQFKNLTKEKRREIEELESIIDEKQKAVDQVRESSVGVQDSATVLTLGKQVAKRVSDETGLKVTISQTINRDMVHSWRTIVTERIEKTRQELKIITQIENSLPDLKNKRDLLKHIMTKLDKSKDSLERIGADYSNNKDLLKELSEKLGIYLHEEESLLLKRGNLQWTQETKPKYDDAKKRIVEEDTKWLQIQSQLQKIAPEIERLNTTTASLKHDMQESLERDKGLQTRQQLITHLKANHNDWMQKVIQRDESKKDLQEHKIQMDNVANELENKKLELNKALSETKQFETRLAELEKSRSELQVILNRIQEHINDKVCPVCGTIHASKEELIQKLEVQRGVQPDDISSALMSVQRAATKTVELDHELKELLSKYSKLKSDCDIIYEKLDRANESIANYEKTANTLNIPWTEVSLLNIVDTAEHAVLEEISQSQRKLMELQSSLDQLQKQLLALSSQKENITTEMKVSESIRNQSQSAIDSINQAAHKRQISLELNDKVIQQELTITNNKIESIHRQIEVQQNKVQEVEKIVAQLHKQQETLENDIQEVKREMTDTQEYIDRIENLAKLINMDSHLDNSISTIKTNYQEKLNTMQDLITDILSFEIALSSAETSAILARDLVEIENMSQLVSKLQQECRNLESHVGYFTKLTQALESQQNQALEEYTTKYGPLTSSIQRRLRSVYGFGDISLHPEKGGIAVRVERKGKLDLSPTDYFSGSQVQIAMLCLFLSATLTQTWSSFAPILLDDPVEHFDDLNSYALVDLIGGLITDPNEGRQFLISTCDERLFRLMRQKFSNLTKKILFYAFDSIGDDGPSVKKLPRDG